MVTCHKQYESSVCVCVCSCSFQLACRTTFFFTTFRLLGLAQMFVFSFIIKMLGGRGRTCTLTPQITTLGVMLVLQLTFVVLDVICEGQLSSSPSLVL